MLYRPGLVGRVPCPGDWYYDGGSPPIIDVDLHKTIPAGWTFSRASTATNCTYQDTTFAGAYTTYAVDQPRFMAFGLLLERGATQYYPNNETPVNGTINLGLNTYTMWCLGPVGCTMVAAAAGAIITGTTTAIPGNPATFTVTAAGNVNFTLAGGVTKVQLESGSSATSFIPTTAGPTTRLEDRLSLALNAPNQQVGTYWVKMLPAGVMPNARLLSYNNGNYASSTGDSISFTGSSYMSGQQASSGGAGTATSQQQFVDQQIIRAAFSVSPVKQQIAVNYQLGGSGTPGGRPNFMTTLWLGGVITCASGYYQGFKYWDRAMDDNELLECTEAGHYSDGPLIEQDFTTGAWPRRWTFAKAVPNGTATDLWMAIAQPGAVAFEYARVADVPRLVAGRGLMIETNHSNFVPNSAAPVTTTPAGNIGVQTYVLSMIGTGSIMATTTTAAGTGFNVPATQGNPVILRLTTGGTIGFTVTGSVEKAQCEQMGAADLNLGPPSSFIKTTASGQHRGGNDKAQMPALWFPINAPHTMVVEFTARAYQAGGYMISAGADTTDREQMAAGSANTNGPNTGPDMYLRANVLPNNGNIGPIDSAQLIPYNVISKGAHSIGENGRLVAMNGVLGAREQRGLPFLSITPMKLFIGSSIDTGTPFNCDFRKVWIYDWAMSEAELIAITT